MKKLPGLMFLLCLGSLYATPPIPANTVLPAASTENTVIIDHFDNATSGENHGYANYTESLPGLGQAADFTYGSSFNIYQIPFNLKAAGTVEAWIYPKKYGKGIFNMNWEYATSNPFYGHVFHLVLQNNGRISLSGWNFEGLNSFGSVDSVPLNKWVHVAVSWGDSTKIYLNGKINMVSALPYRPEISNPVNYGYAPYWGDSLGYMDELHVSNIQLSDEVIASRSAGYNENVPIEKDVCIEAFVPKSVTEMYLTGNYINWTNPGVEGTRMNIVPEKCDSSGNYFSKVIHTYDFANLMYKFTAGPYWSYVQQGDDNRVTNTALDTLFHNQLSFFRIYPGIENTKNVQITVSAPKGTRDVYLMGSHVNWDGVRWQQGVKQPDGTFRFDIPQVDVFEYRYYRETDWNLDERDSWGAPRSNRPADILVSLVYTDVIDRWDDAWIPEIIDSTTYQIPSNIPLQGLTGWWPFNGNANDESGHGNHGLTNNVNIDYDRFGNPNSAYFFNQSSIKLPNQQIINTLPHTISVWAKAPVRNDNVVEQDYPMYPNNILSNDIQLHFGHGIGMNFYEQSSYATLQLHDEFVRMRNLDIHPDQWHHWVMVYDYNNIKLYLDNELVVDKYVTESTFDSNDYLLVGQHNEDFQTYANRLFFIGNIDDIAVWNRALSQEEVVKVNGNRNIIISAPEIRTGTNESINIPVKSNVLFDSDSIMSYQFVLNYNPDVLSYAGVNIAYTMSENGEIVVNSQVPGKLEVAYMSNYHLVGQGDLLTFRFNTINAGTSQLDIADFLYNTEPIQSLIDGAVNVNTIYGDVDNNLMVQAYDAALVLQYSVGLDPLPSKVPYPWEAWRLNAGDVDNSGYLSAYDAGLILQKTVHLIQLFPVEEMNNQGFKAPQLSNTDIIISKDAGNLYFKSYGNLIGLNLSLENNFTALGQPKFYQPNIIKAVNISPDKYEVGLATPVAPADGTTIMSIPLNQTNTENLTLKLRINDLEKYVKFGVITQESSVWENAVLIRPNPVKDQLQIRLGDLIFSGKIVKISNLTGQIIYSEQITNESTVIHMNQFAEPGVFILQIVDENNNSLLIRKIIKE